MEKVAIPISGVDTQADEYSPNDGSCLQMDKFRPVGVKGNMKWKVITEPNSLTFAPDPAWETDPAVPFTVLGVHYAFDTWYAAVYFDEGGGDPAIALYQCTFLLDVLTFDTQVFRASNGGSMSVDLTTEVYFKDFGEDSFFVLISPGKSLTSGQHQLWKVTSDGAEPAVFRPELNLVQVTVNDETDTTADFDNLYPPTRQGNKLTRGVRSTGDDRQTVQGGGRRSRGQVERSARNNSSSRTVEDVPAPPAGEIIQGGTYPGILKDKDKYFGIITAFKHPNGTWVKHSQPHAFKVTGQTASIGTNTEYATLSFGKNPNYTDDSTNYSANVGVNFNLYGHRTASLTWQELGEVGIFMTTGKGTREEAYLEGTYYLLGVLDDDNLFDWSENEETIVTGEVLNVDPFSHHVITSKMISEYKNNLVLIRTVTNFALPGWEWHGHTIENFGTSGDNVINPKINETISDTIGGDALLSNENCALRVTIETENGTFFRWNTIGVLYRETSPGNYQIFLSEILSYPDIQAKQLDFYWYDSSSGQHELFYTESLKQHPFLNIAYSIKASTLGTAFIRSIGYSVGTTAALSFTTDNSQVLVEENEFKVSDLTKLFFPLDWSYQLGDVLNGAIDNTDEMGDGQFGDYPLCVMGKNKIWGARGGDGILIASFDLISDKHGLQGFNAYSIHKNTLFFVSGSGLHALSGRRIEDIYDQVEDVTDNYITTNPNTKVPAIEESYNLFSEIIASDNPMVGVHSDTREIIFSSGGGLLIYNTKYNVWYTYSLFDLVGNPSLAPWEDRGGLQQMMQKGGELSLFFNTYDTADAFIYQWGTDTAQSDKFGIITNPIVLNNYGLFKRIQQCVLQGDFIINAIGSDPGAGNYALNVTLEGRRSTHEGSNNPLNPDGSANPWERIISYTEDTVKTVRSFYIKSNYGSFQAFRLVINGENLAAGSFIANFLCEYIDRGRRFRI